MIKNNKGLTLIEITIGLGITAILGFMSLQFLVDHQKQSKRIEKAIDYKIETLLADKVLLKDFRLAFPSLNQLQIMDDNGKSFFDKYEKIEVNTGLNNINDAETNYARSFRLDASTPQNRSIHLLIQDTTRGDILYAEPVMFYDFGAVVDVNTPTTITFNQNKFLNYINAKNSLMLEPGSLVFIESSVPMPKTVNNYNSRHAAFLAKVNSMGGLDLYNPPGSIFSFNIYSKNAAGAEVTTAISSIDQFLRELPPSANGGSNIRIVPVRLIRYSIRCQRSLAIVGTVDISTGLVTNEGATLADPNDGNCNLSRGEYVNGTLTNIRRVLGDITSVVFIRKNILSNVTNVHYEKFRSSQ